MAFIISFAAAFIRSASSALETFRSLYHVSVRVLLMLLSMTMSLFPFHETKVISSLYFSCNFFFVINGE